MVGENPTPYGILALWAVNGLSIVYWETNTSSRWSTSFLNTVKLWLLITMSMYSRENMSQGCTHISYCCNQSTALLCWFSQVPPGKYQLQIWNKILRYFEMDIMELYFWSELHHHLCVLKRCSVFKGVLFFLSLEKLWPTGVKNLWNISY